MVSTVVPLQHPPVSPPKILPSRPLPSHRSTQYFSTVSPRRPPPFDLPDTPYARYEGQRGSSASGSGSGKSLSAPSSPRQRKGLSAIGLGPLSPLDLGTERSGFPGIDDAVLSSGRGKSPAVLGKVLGGSRGGSGSDSETSSGSMTATPNRSALHRSGSFGKRRTRSRSGNASPRGDVQQIQDREKEKRRSYGDGEDLWHLEVEGIPGPGPASMAGMIAGGRKGPTRSGSGGIPSRITGAVPSDYFAGFAQSPMPSDKERRRSPSMVSRSRNSRSQPDLPSQAQLGMSPPNREGGYLPGGQGSGAAPAGAAVGDAAAQQRFEMAMRKNALEQWHEQSLWMLRQYGGQAQTPGQARAAPPGGSSPTQRNVVLGNAISSGPAMVTSPGTTTMSLQTGRKSPLRQSTSLNLSISPISSSNSPPLSFSLERSLERSRPQPQPHRVGSGRSISSLTDVANQAAASVLGFEAPRTAQIPLSSLPSTPGGSMMSVPSLHQLGPGITEATMQESTQVTQTLATSQESPRPPTPSFAISPPPYTEASSSSGDGSYSPSLSEDGIVDDGADVGVMFTTRARRRHNGSSAGDTSGDGSSPSREAYSSNGERRSYALRPGAQLRRRGEAWDSAGHLSADNSVDARMEASGDSVLGLDFGKLDVLSGEESRWSGDRGVLTTDNEDATFSPRAPRIASSFVQDTTKGRLEDPNLPLVLFILRLLAAVPAAIGFIRILLMLRAADEHSVGTPPRRDLTMALPWAVLTGIFCFDMTTGLTRRWLIYYDLPSTLLRLVSLQSICWPCTAVTLKFMGDKQILAAWVVVGTCTAWSRSVQLWVTSNVPETTSRTLKSGIPRNLSFGSRNSHQTTGSKKEEGRVTGTNGTQSSKSSASISRGWHTSSNGAKIFIRRRTWDWTTVGRAVGWKVGLLYLFTTWFLLLERKGV